MKFAKYQHVEKILNAECDGILNGDVYIFSKLDGSNAGIFKDDTGVRVNSRTRLLSEGSDNQGCWAYVNSQPKFKQYLDKHPNHYLYGEWLKKHTIKFYEDDTWDKIYIFDVVEYDEDGNSRYLTYEEYVPLLEEFGIEYIPLIAKLHDPKFEEVESYVDKCTFLTKEAVAGEGIVCKNYQYANRYGHTIWGKIVRQLFKQSKSAGKAITADSIEEEIIKNLLTPELIEKEYAKIVNEEGWSNKSIPKLLGVVWHTFIVEESFNIIRKYKNPTIHFDVLNKLAIAKIKEVKKELF